MSISEKINEDLKQAMKSKDKIALEALRAAKTAFTLARTNTGPDTVLSQDEELKIIQKLVKQRKDSEAIYLEQNRADLAEKESGEAIVLEKYLPAKLSAQELEEQLKSIIEEVQASSLKDLGKVMGLATKKLAGKADGKDIAQIVKKLLS